MSKFSEIPHFLLNEFLYFTELYGYSPPENEGILVGPRKGIVVDFKGLEIYVKTSTQFLRCYFMPVGIERTFLTLYLMSPDVELEYGDEIYFMKNSEFHDWVWDDEHGNLEEYKNFVNLGKKFLFLGILYPTKFTKQYNVSIEGMKDFSLMALPENNRTEKMEELLYLYFDKVHSQIYNRLKSVWSLKDAIEIESDYIGYLAGMYNVDLLKETVLSEGRLREFVRDLIFWLKRKGTYASLYLIWRIVVGETVNILNIYERWHDWNETLHLDTFQDHKYISFTSYSTSASDYPKRSEYTKGDKYLSTHYTVEADLSYEPLSNLDSSIKVPYIMNETIIRNLTHIWDITRPATRVVHYQEYIEPVVDFSTNYTDMYKHQYDGFCNTKSTARIIAGMGRQTYIKDESSDTWVIDHLFASNKPIIQFFDKDLKQFHPMSVEYYGQDSYVDIIEGNSKNFETGYGYWEFYDITPSIDDATTIGLSGNCLSLTQGSDDSGYAILPIITEEDTYYRLKFTYYSTFGNGNCMVGLSSDGVLDNADWWYHMPLEILKDSTVDFQANCETTYLFIKLDKNTKFFFDDFSCYKIETLPSIVATFSKPVDGYALLIDNDHLHTQENENVNWEIYFDFDERPLILQTINPSASKFFPSNVNIDNDKAVVWWPSGSGYATINKGTFTFAQPTGSAVWQVDHNLGVNGVIAQTYNSTYGRMIPSNVELINKNRCKITFESSTTGYVRLMDVGTLQSPQEILESIYLVKFGDAGESNVPDLYNDVESEIFRTYRNIEYTVEDGISYLSVLVRDKEALDISEIGWFDESESLIFYTYNSPIYKPENVYMKIKMKVEIDETQFGAVKFINITSDCIEVIYTYALSWGDNTYGQLGIDNTTDFIGSVDHGSWRSISSGLNHSSYVTNSRTLWTWGLNSNGQLGQGDIINRSSPVQVGSDADWEEVFCGEKHTLAIKTDGTLWTWGNNTYGQLGQGDMDHRSSPVQIGTYLNYKSMLCGKDYSMLIRSNGILQVWGRNDYGQLGLGDTEHRSYAVQIGYGWEKVSETGYDFTTAIKTDGTLWAWGRNDGERLGLDGDIVYRSSPVQVSSDTTWIDVASGEDQSIALKSDGTLWEWPDNS